MRLFTQQEANEMLPVVRPILENIRSAHVEIGSFREMAAAAATSAQSSGGGGMESGSRYIKLLYEIGRLTLEIDNFGVQLKDYSRGLIDFPCWREGRVVLLCWQLGEGDELEWWHEVEAGFAGRQPL